MTTARPGVKLKFKKGQLFLTANSAVKKLITPIIDDNWLKQGNNLSCDAIYYRKIYSFLIKKGIAFQDAARDYQALDLKTRLPDLYDYQKQALQNWQKSKQGIIVLPTGAGKTVIATSAVANIKRSSLILVPTIDLLKQWRSRLEEVCNSKIGQLGGGQKEIADITVSTYDSAVIYAPKIGNRFCFLIFDEVHHAAAPTNFLAAKRFIAPYRLGLTATMPEDENRVADLVKISGLVLTNIGLTKLTGDYLADYHVKQITVSLSPLENLEYEKHRKIYQNFRYKLGFTGNFKWQSFVLAAHRSAEGRRAFKSFLLQKKIALNAAAKFSALSKILSEHKKEKILVFTNDNESAIKISQDFKIPLITHKTKVKERKTLLENFKSSKILQLVSSRVLNEGIDVPDAGVAVIFSGTSTTREQTQRLGRILRKSDGKKAVLYELITDNTAEVFASQKRNLNLKTIFQ